MVLHELDTNRWGGFREPDIASDAQGGINFGSIFARRVNKYLEQSSRALPQNPSYIGLAAGQGYPELTVAADLGIANGDVTLVDWRFSDEARDRFNSSFEGIKTIKSGIFAFLENPPITPATIVSAFGIEYVLTDERTMTTLITALSRIITPGGFALVAPYTGKDLSDVWKEHGFEPVFVSSVTHIHAFIYVFQP